MDAFHRGADNLSGKCKWCTHAEMQRTRRQRRQKVVLPCWKSPAAVRDKRLKDKKSRDELSDGYVRKLLSVQIGVALADLPEELVVLKRDGLGLRRLAKQLRQAINKEE